MSCNYSIYIGPYIKVQDKGTMKQKTYNGCINNVCKAWKDANAHPYCPHCGRQTDTIIVDYTAPADHDPEDETNGYFRRIRLESDKNDIFYIISDDVSFGQLIDPECEPCASVFDSNKVASILTDFQKTYSGYIMLVKRIYGEQNVTVLFGVINWIW